ncbi:DUF2845 domain-containing protein [Cellvibrio mixtus]|uniref:DUF2845 domain-containing protein n=1 Tax=Cellvibrio mixtus TaxID=39650 RepID=UPI0005878530|nr:DUF2845 domain-containing protein [Cellvibrio mixtus]
MKTRLSLFMSIVLIVLLPNVVSAGSLRCGSKLAQIGDTKAEIIEKCGEPIMTDAYCAPLVAANQIQGTQNGNNNIQNNIAISTCENVDIWTYKPGSGKFITNLYFSNGQLQVIRYGDRVK